MLSQKEKWYQNDEGYQKSVRDFSTFFLRLFEKQYGGERALLNKE